MPNRSVALVASGTKGTVALGALCLLAVGLICDCGLRIADCGIRNAKSRIGNRPRVGETYGRLPLSFEANQGQTDSQVKFLSRGRGYTLFLTSTEAVLGLNSPQSPPRTQRIASSAVNLRMKLVGANPTAQVTGLEELPGKSNYFIGNDPSKWRTNVPNYAKVRYQDVYPGVDLVYYGNQRQLEYDFIVAPGADPSAITLAFDGADKLELDAQGDLVLHVAGGQTCLRKPVAYQQVNGLRQQIAGRYLLQGKRQVRFQVAAYDASQPLVIDPVLIYSTYLGGSGNEAGMAIAVDAAGNAYVTGYTSSANFPTASPLQATYAGGDAFVAKLNAAGNALVYSTYLGGTTPSHPTESASDSGSGIAIDSAGNAYITGTTSSTNFPTVNPLQGALAVGIDVFVAKLNAAGNALLYSTYLGGDRRDFSSGIAVDLAGNAYVTGYTDSGTFPSANPLQGCFGGGVFDAFVAKLNVAGSALVYSTCLGGSSDDRGFSIAVDSAGNAYVTGMTASPEFPLANPLQRTLGGTGVFAQPAFDAFVSKLNPSGSALVYSTYLGGNSEDGGQGIAVDSARNAYVTGRTFSTDFPTVSPIRAAPGSGFVAKINASGSALVYSTYLGDLSGDGGSDIAVDSAGNAYVTGFTNSANFPTVNPLQATIGGSADGFVAKLNPSGSALVYSTYIGGAGGDFGRSIAVDSAGNVYITGRTDSTNFPLANPLQATPGLADDVFVAKISEQNPIPILTSLSPSNAVAGGPALNLRVTGSNFVDPSTVRWNGSNRATAFFTSSQLTTAIPAGDIAAVGAAEVTVFNPGPGGGISNALMFTINRAPNPVPALSSLSPSSATAGGSGFSLTLAGSNFVSDSVVRWNGADRATRFVSSSQLTASIPASDITLGGAAQVTVFNPAPGGGSSNALLFTINAAPPIVNPGGTVNGASFGTQPPAGASIGSLFGANLGSSTVFAGALPLPTTLAGVTVRINGIAAPLFFVSPTQINFQFPWEVLGQTQVSITVTVSGVTSAAQTLPLAPFAPGIFTTNATGSGQGAILIAATGEVAALSGSIPGRAARPVLRGGFISIFCTGLGAVTNQPATGAAALANPLSTTTVVPAVTIGGIPATVAFSGLAPGFVGLYQVNVRVPENAATGSAVPVVLTIGGATSNPVSIAVQ